MSCLLPLFFKRNSRESEPLIHNETHFESPEILRDIVIGLSDGLTVPFALAAGLASTGKTSFVVLGGIAELISGAISMGLGGYLAARSEADHYYTERRREEMEVEESEEEEIQEIIDILEPYGLDRQSLAPVIEKLRANPEKFVDFMMRFELNLERPDPRRSWISALTIGLSYFVGGLIPLVPYLFFDSTQIGLIWSSIVTLLCLLIFGYAKSYYVAPESAGWNAIQTALVGAAAAGFAYAAIYAIGD
ncbi:1182_t:CDS:2 [Paraglomus occultum]|uniref:1182_t:CDS:1 n=1 Tax=Paraglomus occultum TaxID=144539 RepID=A0A9N9AVY2_9GLOM|nr:1182_t:CDS:2 [Paraglomus occultum]